MPAFTFYFSTSLEDAQRLDGFHLLQDHVGTRYTLPWDDFDYIVTFQIQRVIGGVREFFGRTKILIKGVMNTSQRFREQGRPDGRSFEVTHLLRPESTVSLAADIGYYQRLGKELGEVASQQFLEAICDASYYYGNFDYTKWPGFRNSLLRSGNAAQAMIKKGRQIAAGRYEPQARFEFHVHELPADFEPIRFRFDNDRKLGKTNINLLIGRNGSGKSHVLRHVVDQLTGVVESRQSHPYFHKVVVAAYSPFESFKTENQLSMALEKPDQPADALEKMSRRRLMVNEYAYLGFKAPDGRFSLDWPKESSAHALMKILTYDDESGWRDVSRFELLLATLKQSIDFDAIALVAKGGQPIVLPSDAQARRSTFEKAIDRVDAAAGILFVKCDDGSGQAQPIPLSSGQTIYSYLLPNLVAEVEDESLLILDEPELYLHPAMEISLINMVKELLRATKSNAIIATHSSILAREVERLGVVVLRREHERTTVSPPPFETFGQSVELIMGEAFDDYRVRKAYEDSLDKAVSDYVSTQHAMAALEGAIGDEAVAYLASKLDGAVEIVRRSGDDGDARGVQ